MINFNGELEQESIVGALLLQGSTTNNVDIINSLDSKCFTVAVLRDAYDAIKGLIDHGEQIDVLSVSSGVERLHQLRGVFEEVNVFSILMNIAHNTLPNSDATGAARRLRECFRIREIQRTMSDMNQAINEGASVSEVAAVLERELSNANEEASHYQTSSALQLAETYADHLESKIGEMGIRTGFECVDKMIGRISPGHMIVLGGRSGQGKTEFMCAWALDAAKRQDKSVVIFSMEMPKEEIMDRLVAIEAGISPSLLDNPLELEGNDGDWSRNGWAKVTDAVGKIKDLPLYVHDEPEMKLSGVKAVIKKVERDSGRPVDIIYIDYLQNMCRTIHPSVYESVAANSRGTKKLAKDLKIPIVQLAQLSREVEKQDRDPRPSDIRECGQIEADADKIIFIVGSDDEHNQNLKKIIFAKVRQGKKGDTAIGFTDGHFHETNKSFMSIQDIADCERMNNTEKAKQQRDKAYQDISNRSW